MVGQRIEILTEPDIVTARKTGREMARDAGFGIVECTQITTAISELARNILLYAGTGAVTVRTVIDEDGRLGLEVLAEDKGPGIADIDLVLRDGYSTSDGLGLGLSGTKRLMDEFSIISAPREGTVVRVKKWVMKF